MKINKIGTRITIVQAIMISLMAMLILLVSYIAFRKTYLRFYYENAMDVVKIVASSTDWDRLEHFALTGEEDGYSRQMHSFYNDVKTQASQIDYLYLFVPGDTSFTYIIEAQSDYDDPEMIAQWGDIYEYQEDEYAKLLPDVKAQKESTEIHLLNVNTESPGLAVWAPIFDSRGKMQAMVEADYRLPQIYKELNSYVFRILFIFVISSIVAILVLYTYLHLSLIKPIDALTDIVTSYEHGKMTIQMDKFKHDDEIRFMAISFEEMTHRIESYNNEVKRISAEKERIGTELSIATQIQAGMLPNVFPKFVGRDEYEMFASMNPAKEVGGDFYDFFNIDDDHLALVIADVSGKGVPAALFMMISMMLIKNRALAGNCSPAEVLEYVNNQLCESNPNEMFVTVWLAFITLSTGEVIASSAGHEFPAICGESGKYELFEDPHGFVCGAMEGMPYENYEFTIPKDGRLFVYTDGVPEAHNVNDELFEMDRMIDVLNRNIDATTEETIRAMRKAIDEFAGEKPQFDDITMISFIYRGKKNGAGAETKGDDAAKTDVEA